MQEHATVSKWRDHKKKNSVFDNSCRYNHPVHHIVLNACLAYKATLMFLCVGGLYDWEVRAFLNDSEVRKQLVQNLALAEVEPAAQSVATAIWFVNSFGCINHTSRVGCRQAAAPCRTYSEILLGLQGGPLLLQRGQAVLSLRVECGRQSQ